MWVWASGQRVQGRALASFTKSPPRRPDAWHGARRPPRSTRRSVLRRSMPRIMRSSMPSRRPRSATITSLTGHTIRWLRNRAARQHERRRSGHAGCWDRPSRRGSTSARALVTASADMTWPSTAGRGSVPGSAPRGECGYRAAGASMRTPPSRISWLMQCTRSKAPAVLT